MPLFAYPAAAWLLPAIALPVIFHLFFRLRRQVRDFPALLFFQRIDPRLSAKRKLHEWLILLLRCLFIALLLARPDAAAPRRPSGRRQRRAAGAHRQFRLDGGRRACGTVQVRSWRKNATQQLISAQLPGDTVAGAAHRPRSHRRAAGRLRRQPPPACATRSANSSSATAPRPCPRRCGGRWPRSTTPRRRGAS